MGKIKCQVKRQAPTPEQLRMEYVRQMRNAQILENMRRIRERGLTRAWERLMGYRD